ncbi:hypothetical protein [Pseudoxanthomonas suwonensis]|uniref:Transmembrane protein n=1 Tax=Pseudoxanthomonas suwonensis TaxID=314722 RepID=A0A0E3UN64_9GAMM|nr:hypothetical protein [Pseudoxanthomonas suwonensis]AKC86921.1 hypothetical protein WQ53_09305 [Pseudoxanthomonas suwonensis]
MNTPPPLPVATGFVTVLARISLVLAALGLLWALAQTVLALLLPDAAVARMAAEPGVPPGLLWTLEHRHALSLAVLLLSALFLAVAWGLLKRREWARLGFIALLVAGALANFAGLALVGPFFDGLVGMFPAEYLDTPDGRQFTAQMQFNRNTTFATSLLGALFFAGLHGWIVWKLCTAPVRAEFGRRGA